VINVNEHEKEELCSWVKLRVSRKVDERKESRKGKKKPKPTKNKHFVKLPNIFLPRTTP
jgi:hypothetical protein